MLGEHPRHRQPLPIPRATLSLQGVDGIDPSAAPVTDHRMKRPQGAKVAILAQPYRQHRLRQSHLFGAPAAAAESQTHKGVSAYSVDAATLIPTWVLYTLPVKPLPSPSPRSD